VWVGNGTAELIWLLALAYLSPNDGLLIVSPTFGEYAVASRVMGARVQTCSTRPQDGFRLDNVVAQAAGGAALHGGAQDFVRSTVAQTLSAKGALVQDLMALGLCVYPSVTHFFLVEVEEAAATRAGLIAHGMLVRDCTSFGLPTCVRVAARRPAENQRLVAAWQKI
jgi:histidinol-phosphate/aromatic aminotransferase/cobyric acid decarboxylase-like protein